MASYNDVIEGLKILAKYDEKGLESGLLAVDRGVIYAGPDLDLGAIPKEEEESLRKLGWHFDAKAFSWARFV